MSFIVGRPILANLPPYPRPIVSDFDKPTYLPKDRTSYVDGPLAIQLIGKI